MRKRIAAVFAVFVSLVLAQEPVEVKRAPAPVPPLLQQYDFGAQVKALQDTHAAPDDSAKPNFVMTGPPAQPQLPPPPKDLHPKDVPLNQIEREAVRVSERWRGEGTQPAAGPDGRVLYAYGGGLPTVVCAPLRVCIVELQAGEKIVGEPHIGDSVRWNIAPAMYGSGDQSTSVIVLKPQSPGLDTNLLDQCSRNN